MIIKGLCCITTWEVMRLRLVDNPTMLMFDIAHLLDPSLPRICREGFTCDKAHPQRQQFYQRATTTWSMAMHL